jgi:D-amino peptidase
MGKNKYFIISDFEGVSGVVNWNETGRREDYFLFREVQLQELNRIIKTINDFDSDAEIFLRDYHADMRNILFPKLKGRNLTIIRGTLSNTVGLEFDETFTGIILHGFHAHTATPHAVLPHTFSGKIHVYINGIELGETGLLTAVAQEKSVPVIFLMGDKAVCEEHKEVNPAAETLAVKEGYSPVCAKCKTLDWVLKQIDIRLPLALQKKYELKSFINPPYELKVEFSTPTVVLLASFIPGIRVEGNAIYFKSDSVEEIYKLLIIIYILLSEEKSL